MDFGLTPFTAEQPSSAHYAIMGSGLTITQAGFTHARQLNSANSLHKNHVVRRVNTQHPTGCIIAFSPTAMVPKKAWSKVRLFHSSHVDFV